MDRPKVADVWSFTVDKDKTEYYITFVDENIVHLSEVNTGREVPAYPIEFFQRSDDQGWNYQGWNYERTAYEYFCSACEERPHEPDDYLCHECRYGK